MKDWDDPHLDPEVSAVIGRLMPPSLGGAGEPPTTELLTWLASVELPEMEQRRLMSVVFLPETPVAVAIAWCQNPTLVLYWLPTRLPQACYAPLFASMGVGLGLLVGQLAAVQLAVDYLLARIEWTFRWILARDGRGLWHSQAYDRWSKRVFVEDSGYTNSCFAWNGEDMDYSKLDGWVVGQAMAAAGRTHRDTFHVENEKPRYRLVSDAAGQALMPKLIEAVRAQEEIFGLPAHRFPWDVASPTK